MKEILLPIAGVMAFLVVVGFAVQKADEGSLQESFPIQQMQNDSETTELESTVIINDVEIPVEISDNDKKRAKGLSGKESLEEGTGMLFVFEEKIQPVFWMKDMNFPIDIIWIEDDTIVKINKDVPAPAEGTRDDDLARYGAGQLVNYVLEVNAGFSDEIGIEVGDKVEFSLN